MKKILIGLAVVAGLVVAAGGVLVWRASAGLSPAALESRYATSADRFVEIAGARVRVREEGPQGAPPILLIHGFTHSLETWDGWAKAFSKTHRVIRYDLLGHGLTGPDPKERYAPEERAAFVGDVLDGLGVEHAVIVGNSLGGLAAWRFAHDHPDRAQALILISPGVYSLNGVSDEPAEIPAAMKAYLMTAPEAGVAASAKIIYGDDSKLTTERLKTMRAMMRRRGNGEAMIKSLEEFTLPDPTALLQDIETPTLILWGEADAVIPIEQGRRMQAEMPNAALITYPGVGHAAQEEAPEETVADAIEFLESLSANGEEGPE
ncbi:alpha/beta fold hydrolase [Hyphococcus luteus]|uniref:alpha/beta fold hydrolase n=1 Tax=Hyphococcus luteus TaxID=2058213 RepID=UPI0013FDE4C1|nr:alpha/beta hydrolase [Marinicaulis flavus]